MRIRYFKNNQLFETALDNEDLSLQTKVSGHRTTVSLTAKEEIVLDQIDSLIDFKVNNNDLYFLNGYQSWTDTKEFKLSKKLRNINNGPHLLAKLFSLKEYGDALFYKYSRNKSHGYDVFYSKGQNECFLFNLNYEIAYLIIELIKNAKETHLISDTKGIKLQKGESVIIYDYCFYDNFSEGLEAFNKQFPKKNVEKLFGYTSWYNYYQNITEDIILRDLDALDERFNLCQIDDGYEAFVGDWEDVNPEKFPNGLAPIVKKIHEKGLKAGLWLAPFAAETKSRVFQEHPDWIRKDKKGNMIKAGCNWSGFYLLDVENPEVVAYIRKFLTHYMDMGFDFFKLDFLYSVGLPNYEGMSRCQAQNKGYKLLREILKDKLILGCGAEVINSYKNFDYLRIGPDVSLIFDDAWYMRMLHRERVSTKVTLQNTIFRSIFNDRLFGNDPDVFLLRDENMKMSFEQRKALTKINALFGSVLLMSDDIATYNDEKKAVLAEALHLFRNAEVLSYETKGKTVDVKYRVDGQEHQFTYDTNKGVLLNER